MAKLELEVAGLGAAVNTYSERMGQFPEAVKKYQDALLVYRDTKKFSEASKEAHRTAKETARNTFDDMQLKFKKELSVVTSATRARPQRFTADQFYPGPEHRPQPPQSRQTERQLGDPGA